MKSDEISFIELEWMREHLGELPDAVQELTEHRWSLFLLNSPNEATPVCEFMAKWKPFLFNQSLQKITEKNTENVEVVMK